MAFYEIKYLWRILSLSLVPPIFFEMSFFMNKPTNCIFTLAVEMIRVSVAKICNTSCRFPGVNLSKCEYITFDQLRYEWTSCLSLVLISFKISYLPKSLLSTICGKKEKAFEHLLLLDGIIWLHKLKYSNENTKYVFWGNFTYLPENGCRFLK